MSNIERIYYMLQENDCGHWFRDNADALKLAEYLDKMGCVAMPEMICRCKDCKHANDKGTICRYSVGRPVEPEHFCSYGTPQNDEVRE